MIGIIFIGDLKYCPYLKKYIDILEESNKKYEVLFWNRENKELVIPPNYIPFNLSSKLNRHPMEKITDFLKWRNWIKKRLKEKKYDKLILLSTLSGVFIANELIRKYKNRYIFDIRDYSYEHNWIFYNIEKIVIKNSKFTCISSEGFKNFLPKEFNYITTHNFNKVEMKYRKMLKKKEYGEPLNLVWNGAVRYYDHQKEIIARLKNNPRFNIIYHGSGPHLDQFKKFCEDNKIKNVTFTGEYNNEDKAKLLEDADILNNSYKIKNMNKVKYAISNKYYDGMIFGIPQIVETETFKSKKISKKYLGIDLDIMDEKFGEKLYEYYFSINVEKFNQACDQELKKVLEEDKMYSQSIIEFIK